MMQLNVRKLQVEKQSAQDRQFFGQPESKVLHPQVSRAHNYFVAPRCLRRLKHKHRASLGAKLGYSSVDVPLYSSRQIRGYQQDWIDLLFEQTMHVNGSPGVEQRICRNKVGNHCV